MIMHVFAGLSPRILQYSASVPMHLKRCLYGMPTENESSMTGAGVPMKGE